jgi:hypothetical protein
MAVHNPLDRIRNWEHIHGLNDYLLNRYSKLYKENAFGGVQKIDNPLFSKEKYIESMIFREKYIKKLYTLLKEKLGECTIHIHVLPKYKISTTKSFENQLRNLNGEAFYNNGINIFVECGGRHRWIPIKNVADDSIEELLMLHYPEDIKRAVYDSVKQMKFDASNIILPKLLKHHYRPPEGNEGGPGYSRTKASVTGFGPSRKLRKGRKNRKARKTRKTN